VQDLAGPEVLAFPAPAGDKPFVPAGEPVAAVTAGVLVVADQEGGHHVEGGLADEHAGAIACAGEVLTFAHLRQWFA
jgi:hypothetical protein